jgi:hypothetical protein
MRRDLIRLNLRLFVYFYNTTYAELEVRNRRYQQKIRVLCQRKWLFGGNVVKLRLVQMLVCGQSIM